MTTGEQYKQVLTRALCTNKGHTIAGFVITSINFPPTSKNSLNWRTIYITGTTMLKKTNENTRTNNTVPHKFSKLTSLVSHTCTHKPSHLYDHPNDSLFLSAEWPKLNHYSPCVCTGQPICGSVISVNLELLYSVHTLQNGKALQGNLWCAGHKLDETSTICLIKRAQCSPKPLDLNVCRSSDGVHKTSYYLCVYNYYYVRVCVCNVCRGGL